MINTPTKITIARIAMIPIFIALVFIRIDFMRVGAAAVFIIASATDALDGYLARKNNQITDLGKFLDPLADKLLVTCALVAVAVEPIRAVSGFNSYPFVICIAIFAMIIICRELAVSGLRMIVAQKNVVLAADKLGKIKTILQMSALVILIPIPDFYLISQQVGDIIFYIGFGLLCSATAMTIASAVNYFYKNKSLLSE